MKFKLNLTTNNKLTYGFLLFSLVVFFFKPFDKNLIVFLLRAIEQETLSIGLLLTIKNLLMSSEHIPLIGGASAGVTESLSEVIKYLSWSDVALTSQLIILKLSQTVVFKAALLIAVAGMFISSYHSLSLKILVVLLLINPGLPAYVTLANYISQEVKLDDGSDLHDKIQDIHQKYNEKEKERQQAESTRDQKQLEQAHKKGKKDISGVKKLEDKLLDDGSKVVDKVEEGVSEGFAIVKAGSKELLIMSINYIVTVAIQFLLLPFLYLYGVFRLIKHFINHDVSEIFLNKAMLLLLVTLLISGSTKLFATETDEIQKTQKNIGLVKPVDSANSQVLGIDVSHFQNDIDWDEIKSAKISFVYAKATQSTNFVDPKFKQNWTESKAAGLTRGAYHFYMAGEDPKVQAELFIKTVGEVRGSDLPPMLDLEEGGMKPGIDPDQYRKNVLIWLDLVERKFGKRPIIYTDYPYGSKYLTLPEFAKYRLWIADWEKQKEPKVPAIWDGKWMIWQRTERGEIEGAVGNVDHDLFDGNHKELKKLR